MEFMPAPWVMNDMLLLPTGDVILINGATHGNGSAGSIPVVRPLINNNNK